MVTSSSVCALNSHRQCRVLSRREQGHGNEEWKNCCVHLHRSQVSVSGQLGEPENLIPFYACPHSWLQQRKNDKLKGMRDDDVCSHLCARLACMLRHKRTQLKIQEQSSYGGDPFEGQHCRGQLDTCGTCQVTHTLCSKLENKTSQIVLRLNPTFNSKTI